MPGPARSSNVGYPIRVFADIPSSDTLEAFSLLINDINKYLAQFAGGIPPNSSTVAALPAGLPEGSQWWASNGRKIGEGPGSGTGVQVYYSAGAWRVVSLDSPVLA
jgi:hypothetical protein